MKAFGLLTALVLLIFTEVQTDEFGRLFGISLVAAAILSTVKGLIAATVTLFIAYVLSYFAYLRDSRVADAASTVIANSLDAIPAVLWVLVVVSVSPEPRGLVALVVFVFVSMPSSFRLVHGEVRRLAKQEYVQASKVIGTRKMMIFGRHIAPNSYNIVVPTFISLTGNAIAIDGAIGLLGLGNRSDLNLGAFLIRGKEQIFTQPVILIATLIVYSGIFFSLERVRKKVRHSAH
jgi:peptide/nickel transport system permease protein